MRRLRLPTIVLATFAMVSLLVYAGTAQRKFQVVNDTTADTSEQTVVDDDGNEVTTSCAGTLEAKCTGQSSYVAIGSGASEVLACTASDDGINYRSVSSVGAWHDSVTFGCAAEAPEDAVSSTQIVTISGTVSACASYPLTSASSCRHFCKGADGVLSEC